MNIWGMRKTVGAIGVAAAIAGVGGAAIAAATDGGHSMIEGGMHGFGGPPSAMPAALQGVGVGAGALHGEYVVSDGHGGFSTLVSQTGRVTAISSTSVTARSADGFSQTYVIRDTTRSPSVTVNDQVTISAKRNGEAALVVTMQPPVS